MRLFVLGLGLLAGVACTRSSNTQSTSSNKPQTSSSGRPSENGEGVPGYLANPKAISFTHDGTHLTVKGGVGNLQSIVDYTALPIHVYRLPTPTEANTKKIGDDAYEISADLIVSSFANPDGSIMTRGPASGTGPYIMKVGGLSTDPLLISAYQTHVTYVFADGAESNGRLLSLRLLREKYPSVFPSPVASLDNQASCNTTMRYWNSMTEECTSLQLAKLRNCWSDPDATTLYTIIKEKIGSDEKSELKDLTESGATLDQCHYSEKGDDYIEIVFIEPMDGGMKLNRVTVKTKDVKDFLIP